MIWEIKSKLGVTKATVDKPEYNDNWMGECYVTATIESPCPIDFAIGDYLMYRGERFEINYDPGKIKCAPQYAKGDAFKYENVKFNSLADELTRCDFLDVVLSDNQLHFTGLPKFTFYGGVKALADRMQANLDRAYGENAWSVVVDSEFEDKTEINISVDNIKVQGALEILVNDLKTYYTIKGRTITIGSAGVPASHLFKYGKGNGLYELEQNAEADQAIVTRLRAYGSTRNLPHRYYNSLTDADGEKLIPDNMAVQYLMLPSFPYATQDPYIDSDNISALGVREGAIFFDGSGELEEIYPSIEGMTAEQLQSAGVTCNSEGALDVLVSAEQIEDDGVGEIEGSESTLDEADSYFKVTVKDLGFDINDYLIEGNSDVPTVSFKSGKLGGRDFEIVTCTAIKTNNTVTGYELELKRVFDDGIGLWFPYKDYNAAKDDKFVLLHIGMPEVYIKAASQRLKTKAEEWLAKNDYSRSIYNPKIDEIFMARQHDAAMASNGTIESLHDTLRAGMLLLFEDEDLNIDASVFIDQLIIKEGDNNGIATYEITLKEEKTVGRLDKMQNQIDSLASGQGQGGGYTASQIRNLISAYGGQMFLSKLKDDRTPYKVASDKGFEVGRYIGGAQGAFVGFDADKELTIAEVDKLYVRVKAYFEELTIIKASVLAGKQYITPGGGIQCTKVEEVKDDDGNVTGYKCYFLAEQDGEKIDCKFVVGDQAISEQFNAKTGTSNKISNHRYWRAVTEVNNTADADGYGYIILSATNCEDNSDAPQAGDEICQLGYQGTDTANKERQSAMVFSTVDSDSPSIHLYSGINDFSLDDRAIVSFGRNVNGVYFRLGNSKATQYLDYNQTDGLEIKGKLSVNSTIGDQSLSEYFGGLIPDDKDEYLRKALKGSTVADGGLVLSSLVKLGAWTENTDGKATMTEVMSGLSGVLPYRKANLTDAEALANARSPFLWGGGDMIDKFNLDGTLKATLPDNYARTMLRMDGSAYFADGNVGFEADGSGWLGDKENGIKFNHLGVLTVGSGVTFNVSNVSGLQDTLDSIANFQLGLEGLLTPCDAQDNPLSWGEALQSDGAGGIKAKSLKANVGFWSTGFVSARGLNADGSSSSGATTLNQLDDVFLNAPSDGQSLVYSASANNGEGGWVNQTVQSGTSQTYTHPTDGANTTISEGEKKVLSAITVDSLGHVTSVSSKELTSSDIPDIAISQVADLQTSLDAKLTASSDWKASVDTLLGLFTLEGNETDGYKIKANYGLYTESFLSARGANPDATSTSGIPNLNINPATLASGQALIYNGSEWVNQTLPPSGLTTNDVNGLISTALTGYAKTSDIPAPYTHPTDGANTTIAEASMRVISAITVNNLGHVTSVSYKALAESDIPTLPMGKIDGLTSWKSTVDAFMTDFGNFFDLEKADDGTPSRIKALVGLYTDSFLSARGLNPDASQGGGIADFDAIVPDLTQWLTTNSYAKTSDIPSSTTYLAEGTNLYYTDARAQSALSGHTSDTAIHVTAQDKATWNGKADASALDSYVTLGTAQTIDGVKTFGSAATFNTTTYMHGAMYMGDSNQYGIYTDEGCLVITNDESEKSLTLEDSGELMYGGHEVLDTSNYATSLDGRYVKKAGDTMTGNLTVPSISGCTRISNTNNGNLALGNANNSGWVLTQDICSHNGAGDTYWSLRTDGTMHIKKIVMGDCEITYDSSAGGLHFTKGIYSDSFVSARGANSDASGGGGDYLTSVSWDDVTDKPDWIGATKPSYAWSEITGKPSWIGATKPSYAWSEITGKPSWIGANKPTYAFADLTSHPTTLAQYGITDAKIEGGVITLGSNTITPVTSLSGYATTNWVSGNYLPLTGGTLSGTLHLLGSQYTDTANTGALNLNNSDIYGVNSIKFSDLCDTAAEGLQWYRDAAHVDTLWVNTGVIYFTPNRAWGGTATNYTVWHSGNLNPSNYLGISAKAADSDKLDGIDSTGFVRTDGRTSGTLDLNTYTDIVFKEVRPTEQTTQNCPISGFGSLLNLWSSEKYASMQFVGSPTALYYREKQSAQAEIKTTWHQIAFTSDIKTDTAQLSNGAGFITSSAISDMVTKSGAQEISGAKIFSSSIGVKQTAGTGVGISLYGSSNAYVQNYGIMFALTSNFAKHGAVQGDWATYFTMDGAVNRGWIFRHASQGNVASVNAEGKFTGNAFIKSGGTNTQFLMADGSSNGTAYLPLSGGTLSGELTANRYWVVSGRDAKIILDNTDTEDKYQYIDFRQNGTSYGTLGTLGSATLVWNGNTLWHSGNDGSGSGLDADLLDGVHASSLLKVDGSNGTANGVSALLNKLTEGTSTPVDADYFISQYVNGGTTTTTYYRRPVSKLWNYINGKASSVYAKLQQANDFIEHTNEFNFVPSGYNYTVWFNYRGCGDSAVTVSEYKFGNGDKTGGYAKVKASEFIKDGGTSSQFLKADGSTDSNTYVTTDTAQTISGSKTFTADIKASGIFRSTRYANPGRTSYVAFLFGKPSSNYTGIGANGTADTIYFSACDANGDWVNDYKQIWKFNGSIKIGNITLSEDSNGNLHIDKGVYSDSFVSARGSNPNGGSGGGGNFNLMREWPSSAPSNSTTDALGANLGWDLKQNKLNATKSAIEGLLTGSITSHTHGYITNGDNVTAISGTTVFDSGLRLYSVYNNGYPCTYGNLLRIGGVGKGEMVFGWTADTSLGRLYYRSKRDHTATAWSGWGTVAYLSDIPTNTAQLSNGAGFITSSAISDMVTKSGEQTITGIKSFTNRVRIVGTTETPAYNSVGLTFAENATDGQAVSLIYTSYDSYRSPAGIKVIGHSENAPESVWFEAPRFIKTGGTSSQFLKADGSVDGNSYALSSSLSNYLPLTGGTLTGSLSLTEYKHILLRPSNSSYTSGIGYDTSGNECIALWAKNPVTRLRWYAGSDMSNGTAGFMMGITPDFEISKASGVAIGYISGNTIWHSGNDGSGSGLDADTVDGVHNGNLTAQYLNPITGIADFNATLSANGIYTWGGDVANQPNPYGSMLQWANVNNPVGGTMQHWITQLASSTNNRLYYRTRTNNADWTNWQTLAFTSDNVASASKLSTTSSYSAWGQTYWSDGVPNSISGDLSSVGNITANGGTYKFLTYPTALYGLVVKMNTSGCVLMQSQRAANDSETFAIALNPNGGNVGIGITTPSLKLDVNGVARATALMGSKVCIECNSSGVTAGRSGEINRYSGALHLQYDTTNNTTLCTGGGNVGIGLYNPSYKLHVAGVAYASTGIFSDGYVSARGQNTSSDIRLKTNLTPFEIALHQIANAPSVNFDWKEGSHDVGSIAQYWENVNPHLTPKDPNGWLTLQYGKTALLSVISVAKEVESHEQRIARLEKENMELKNKIFELERR